MTAGIHVARGQAPPVEVLAAAAGQLAPAMFAEALDIPVADEAVIGLLPMQRVAIPAGAAVVADTATTEEDLHEESDTEVVESADDLDMPDDADESDTDALAPAPRPARHEWGADAATTDSVKVFIEKHGAPRLDAAEEVRLAKLIEAGLAAETKLLAAEEDGVVLDPEYEADLRAIQREGERSKDRFFRANLRLVAKIAGRYTPFGSMGFWDFFQEGTLGLIRAIEKFDYTRGLKFSTPADYWIREAITTARAWQARQIRIPKNTMTQINALHRARRTLRQGLKREPTLEELATEMEVKPEKVAELSQCGYEPSSLNVPPPHSVDEESELSDFMVDADAMPADDVAILYASGQHIERKLLRYLTPDEALLVSLRAGLRDGRQYSPAECAIALECHPKTITRRWGIIMKKLREPGVAAELRQSLKY